MKHSMMTSTPRLMLVLPSECRMLAWTQSFSIFPFQEGLAPKRLFPNSIPYLWPRIGLALLQDWKSWITAIGHCHLLGSVQREALIKKLKCWTNIYQLPVLRSQFPRKVHRLNFPLELLPTLLTFTPRSQKTLNALVNRVPSRISLSLWTYRYGV